MFAVPVSVVALAASTLAGCASDPDDTLPRVAEPSGVVVEVQSLDNTFRAADVTVAVGTEVRWTNVGRNDHDVVPEGGEGGWGVGAEDFAPEGVYSHVFTEPGTYEYLCTIHGKNRRGMVGTIIVTD